MTENRPTGPGAPPVRTLLHRGLPEPLPRRARQPAIFLLWFPLLMVMLFVLPVWIEALLDDEGWGDSPSVLLVTLSVLAALAVYGYELVAALRRRRR